MKAYNEKSTITLNNGVEMPRLGLGVWKANLEDTAKAVQTAIELGYPMIDTAKQYGNEAGVGTGIKAGLATSGRKRDTLFVTTKIFNGDQGYDTTLSAFEGSLNRLQLEYVDMLLIHWPVPGKYLDTWRALEQILKDGRARAIGVSNFDQETLENLLDSTTIVPAINQLEIQPYFQQTKYREFLESQSIIPEAWSPLGGGQILNDPVLAQIAQKHHKTPAQIILRWDLQSNIITIPKSIHTDRIKQNMEIFDFELSPEDLASIKGLERNQRTGPWLDVFPWYNPQSQETDTVKEW